MNFVSYNRSICTQKKSMDFVS